MPSELGDAERFKGTIGVLDHGYVRLLDWMGSDLNPVNAARASYAKESKRLNQQDIRLLDYLTRRNEMSPFRHAVLWFEVKAPLLVARQWYKYRVGAEQSGDTAEHLGQSQWEGNGDEDRSFDPMYARNEMSRRYVTAPPEF